MRALTSTVIPATVIALGCADKTAEEPGGPAHGRWSSGTYEVAAHVDAASRSGPMRVIARITFVNTGTTPADLVLPGGCPVSLSLQAVDGGRTWDQTKWREQSAALSGFVMSCADTAQRVRLAPGEKAVVEPLEAPTIADVLGDSLSPGEYDVTATVSAPAGSPPQAIPLSAGRVRLNRPVRR
jgi:hypothetical protein